MPSDFPILRSLISETLDGEWGSETASPASIAMRVIRGTDFDAARSGDLNGVPIRYVPNKTACRKTLRPWDILIETAGGSKGRSTGRTVLIEPDLIASSSMLLTCASFARFMRIDALKADPRYVYWYLQYLYRKGEMENHQVQHTGIARFQFTRFAESVEIPLPSRDVQSQVADILCNIDRRVNSLRTINVTLEAIARAIFRSWFVDFDPVKAKAEGREPEGMDAATAALFPSEFQDSQLGCIPGGWCPVTLGEISDVGIGKTPPRAQTQWFCDSPHGVTWVSIKDMGQSGLYIGNSSENLTAEAVERFNIRLVPDDTVLVSFKLTVGRVCISDGTLTTNEAIAHCRPRCGEISPEFLYCALKSYDFTQLGSTSSIAEAVNSKSIRAIRLLIPASSSLRAFTDICRPLFRKIKLQRRQMRSLTELRDSLLPRLISGKLRVPEAEEMLAGVV